MKIAIAGGSGFVGKALTKELLKGQHDLYILTRNAVDTEQPKGITVVQWLNDGDKPENQLEDTDVFINLAGESLSSGRWTAVRKRRLLESRLIATTEINRIISALNRKPSILLNASAIGYYGTSHTQTFTEKIIKYPSDFLSEVTDRWEKAAEPIAKDSIRTVYMRFGVILGKNEGALPRMIMPYKLYVGGTIGSGQQILSWIHIKDIVQAILFCIHNDKINGAVNFTAPNPQNMKEFGNIIGQVLGSPHWLPVPSFVLKLMLGEMSILILEGQRVLPEKLLSQGFTFSFPTLDDALQDILN